MSIIRIKQIKKVSYFCLFVCGFVLITPLIVAYRPPVTKYANGFGEFKGYDVYGDVNSLKYDDSDEVHWHSSDYGLFIGWQFGTTIGFNYPSSSYPVVYLSLKFRYDAASGTPLRIIVYYVGGGSDPFYEYPTGGGYDTVGFTLASNKRVEYVSISNGPSWWYDYPRPALYIEYIKVIYSDPY